MSRHRLCYFPFSNRRQLIKVIILFILMILSIVLMKIPSNRQYLPPIQGYQTINENIVGIQSHLDSSRVRLGPEVGIQSHLDSSRVRLGPEVNIQSHLDSSRLRLGPEKNSHHIVVSSASDELKKLFREQVDGKDKENDKSVGGLHQSRDNSVRSDSENKVTNYGKMTAPNSTTKDLIFSDKNSGRPTSLKMKRRIIIKGGEDVEMCPFPKMDPFLPSIMKFVIKNSTLNCSAGVPSLVYVDGRYLIFNKTKADVYNLTVDICQYRHLRMVNGSDHVSKNSDWSKPFITSIEIPASSENLVTVCKRGKKIVSQTYSTFVKIKPSIENKCEKRLKLHKQKYKPREILNLLLVGIDGMSRGNMIRLMPKTRDFVINQLGGLEMFKLNKVGDNTLPNLAAFLGGSTMNQLRENFSFYDEYIDKIDHKFIWKHFSDAGYRVGFIADRAHVSAFHYQKKGWNKPVFDYYHRPAVVTWDKDKVARKASEFCVGQEPEMTHLFDYWLQMTTLFNDTRNKQPYFGYSFFCHLTHDDPNFASAGDEPYLEFFKNLKQRNVLNNTVLVFFSDHGPRFGPIRHSYSGLLETRNPMMFFIFPDWFRKKYPNIMRAFHINQNRLTTFFDAHATFKDILYFTGKSGKGSTKEKAISLFREIPQNRTCMNAGISMNYCLCTQSSNVEAAKSLWGKMGQEMMEVIVNSTTAHRQKCHLLGLETVKTVVALKDDRHRPGRQYFRAIISTNPGGAVYEGLLVFYEKTKRIASRAIPTRLNLYRGQAECVEAEEIRPFCVCKDRIDQSKVV